MTTKSNSIMAIALGLTVISATVATAQPFIYPNRGQSQRQQDEDRGACDRWATQQVNSQGNSGAGGAVLRDGARGAAAGAVGGAFFGQAGSGAGAGAALGVLNGVYRRGQNQGQSHNQAFAACMQGRGYSVTF